MNNHNFFCISFYEGNVDWIEQLSENRHIVYCKGRIDSLENSNLNWLQLPNVGYNIHSYLTYIIDNYENLPNVVVFCKNNVFDRHVPLDVFESCVSRNVFTPIEDPSRWNRLGFPVSVLCSDGGFLELNTNWFSRKFQCKYFNSFNDFYKFIFKIDIIPSYIRFAPGANYVVPRDNILLRSKNFYTNLRFFVEHSQYSVESHYVERSLFAIWNSTLKESDLMSVVIDRKSLPSCVPARKNFIKRLKNKTLLYVIKTIFFFVNSK
jgi:hypothetical protein